jgi:hypothetical protein
MKTPHASWLLAGLLLASQVFALKSASVEQDPDADLSAPRAFAMVMGTPWGSPICEKRVLEAVARRLEDAGWTRTEEAGASLLVVLHGSTKEKRALHAFYNNKNGWAWRGWGASNRAEYFHDYTERTLVVDIFEADGRRLVWRGTARGVASENPQRDHSRIERGLRRLFRAFPRARAGGGVPAGEEGDP